jgi:hypothetical protein
LPGGRNRDEYLKQPKPNTQRPETQPISQIWANLRDVVGLYYQGGMKTADDVDICSVRSSCSIRREAG